MIEKIKHSFFNIFLLCFGFVLLFFIKIKSFAQTSFIVTCQQNWSNVDNTVHFTLNREWRFPSTSSDRRFAFYYLEGQHRYVLCSNLGQSFTYDFWYAYVGEDAHSFSTTMTFATWNNMFGGGYNFYGSHENNNDAMFGSLQNAVYDFGGIPVFSDLDDISYYLEFGTMPELPFI